jgi:hypothetical protein
MARRIFETIDRLTRANAGDPKRAAQYAAQQAEATE